MNLHHFFMHVSHSIGVVDTLVLKFSACCLTEGTVSLELEHVLIVHHC